MFEVALPVLYVASFAGFFAWAGRKAGGQWVWTPIAVGAVVIGLLAWLWMTHSTLFTPSAIAAVFIPVGVAYVNRATGYRWWPSFSLSRKALITWLVLGGVFLVATWAVFLKLALGT